jgi:hypothetical protein
VGWGELSESWVGKLSPHVPMNLDYGVEVWGSRIAVDQTQALRKESQAISLPEIVA